jgi:hypothetical protein
MKALFLIIPLISFVSCTTSKPESPPDPALQELLAMTPEESAAARPPVPPPVRVPVRTPAAAGGEADFDPGSISRTEFAATKSEIQLLVEEINRVIRAQDYGAWLSYLSDGFIRIINSPEFLTELSQSSRRLLIKKIQLKSSRDYFTHVVVASRENVRVEAHLDDIEFLSHNRVKAFTLLRNQRLRLFDFVRDGNTWKIAPPS